MSIAAANECLERAETDKDFASQFEDVKDSQSAVLEKVREAGYDITPGAVVGGVIGTAAVVAVCAAFAA